MKTIGRSIHGNEEICRRAGFGLEDEVIPLQRGISYGATDNTLVTGSKPTRRISRNDRELVGEDI